MAGALCGGRRRPRGIVAGFVVTLVPFRLAPVKAFDGLGRSASWQRNIGVASLALFAVTLIARPPATATGVRGPP